MESRRPGGQPSYPTQHDGQTDRAGLSRSDQHRPLQQYRDVTMQIRRSEPGAVQRYAFENRVVLMRGAITAAIIAVLGVALAVIGSSNTDLASAIAPPDGTIAPFPASTISPPTAPGIPTPAPATTPPVVVETTAAPPVPPTQPVTVATPPDNGSRPDGEADGDADNSSDDGSGYGQAIDPGGVNPDDQDENDGVDVDELPPDGPGDCGVWGWQDGDQDGIPSRFDHDPCEPDHVAAAAPCDSYAGTPQEDPFGDWDRDGVINGSDTNPCDSTIAIANGNGLGSCELSESGTGDGDGDGIADRWDYDPCVPDHVSSAAPCESYNGDPADDPTGDWDADDNPNQSDPSACDPMVA